MARQFTEITKEWQRTAQANATASPGPPMCSSTAPPTTCVTGPIDAHTHSHVVPRGNKAPRGPTASPRDRTRREPAGGHFARLEAPPAPTPTLAAYLIHPTEGPRLRGLFTGLPRPARRFRLPKSPAVSGGYSNGRTTSVISNLNQRSSVGTTSIRQSNSVPAHQIGKNLILHWNSEDGGKKVSWSTSNLHKGEDEERKENGCCSLLLSSSFLPLLTKKRIFPQYFSLIKERPKTYSHQKNPDRMSMFDPGVVAAAGPKRKKKN